MNMEMFKSRLRARSWSFKDKAKFHKHRDKRSQSGSDPKLDPGPERMVTWQEEYYRRRALRSVLSVLLFFLTHL